MFFSKKFHLIWIQMTFHWHWLLDKRGSFWNWTLAANYKNSKTNSSVVLSRYVAHTCARTWMDKGLEYNASVEFDGWFGHGEQTGKRCYSLTHTHTLLMCQNKGNLYRFCVQYNLLAQVPIQFIRRTNRFGFQRKWKRIWTWQNLGTFNWIIASCANMADAIQNPRSEIRTEFFHWLNAEYAFHKLNMSAWLNSPTKSKFKLPSVYEQCKDIDIDLLRPHRCGFEMDFLVFIGIPNSICLWTDYITKEPCCWWSFKPLHWLDAHTCTYNHYPFSANVWKYANSTRWAQFKLVLYMSDCRRIFINVVLANSPPPIGRSNDCVKGKNALHK